jgi:hypothetical protein
VSDCANGAQTDELIMISSLPVLSTTSSPPA